jgi:hypothetical protein
MAVLSIIWSDHSRLTALLFTLTIISPFLLSLLPAQALISTLYSLLFWDWYFRFHIQGNSCNNIFSDLFFNNVYQFHLCCYKEQNLFFFSWMKHILYTCHIFSVQYLVMILRYLSFCEKGCIKHVHAEVSLYDTH